MPSTRQSIYQTDQIVIKKLYANRQKTGVSHNPGAKSTQERLGSIPGRPRSVPEPPGNVPGASQERPRSVLGAPWSVPGAFLSVPKASPERPSSIPEPPESPKNPPEAILPRFQLAQGRSWGASGPSPERFFMTFFAHPFVFCIHANGAGNATQQDVAAHGCRSQIALPQRLFHNDLFQPSHRDDSCCWLFVVASSFFVHCTKAL